MRRLGILSVTAWLIGCGTASSGSGTCSDCAGIDGAGVMSGSGDVDRDAPAPDVPRDTESDAGGDAADDRAAGADGSEPADAVADLSVDPADTSEGAETSAGDLPPDERDDAGGDAGASCADPNGCGGCVPLRALPDEPCGSCFDGRWVCAGSDDVACVGAALEPADWWVDGDADGFGDAGARPSLACAAPDGAVDNAGDCDDRSALVHPGADELCDGIDQDCDGGVDEGSGVGCADACCSDGLVCEEGLCRARCDGRARCGSAPETCCAADEVCYADACTPLGGPCRYTEDCAIEEICEPTLGLCLPRTAVPACTFVPPVGTFAPELDCRWTAAWLTTNPTHDDVVASPIVLNLTDDDGDGDTDAEDDPDVAFLTYAFGPGSCCNVAATLRVASGVCAEDGSMNTLASISAPELTNDSGIAGGDLDGDGVPEIVAITRIGGAPTGAVAFRRDAADGSAWSVMWQNSSYPSSDHTRGGAAISIANLDAAGAPEVIIGNVALRGDTGALYWDGRATSGGAGGIGNNAFLGPTSAVGDVDLDGFQEVAAGNTLYRHDGVPLWTFAYTTSNSECGGAIACDGFNGLGNFDADDEAEIVAVRRGEVFIWHHDGALLWRAQIPVDDCPYNESGPPTIADFDGDGAPEIGTASADFYVVLDPGDCDTSAWRAAGCAARNIRWTIPNQDCSSRATGSSVFDFEGDGRAEVIYADETSFRILDGATGAELFNDPTHGSHTRLEMPVIADVDNDGNAEIIIPENASNSGLAGIDIWADTSDNWVRTRRIWNQHAYSVTNVNEDGSIPTRPEINWLNPRLNHWRQNTQPGGLFDAPDLEARVLLVDPGKCPLRAIDVVVEVANAGALSVPAGIEVELRIDAGAGAAVLTTVRTTTRLYPGESETIDVAIPMPVDPGGPFDITAEADPAGEVNECVEDNNAHTAGGIECDPR